MLFKITLHSYKPNDLYTFRSFGLAAESRPDGSLYAEKYFYSGMAARAHLRACGRLFYENDPAALDDNLTANTLTILNLTARIERA